MKKTLKDLLRPAYRFVRFARNVASVSDLRLCWRTMRRGHDAKLSGRDARGLEPVRIALRNEAAPIYVRPGTTDLAVFEIVLFDREYRAVCRHLSDAKLILDLGGNVGASVRLWRRHAPEAHIVVVEPDPGNLEMLRRNCGADPKVTVLEGCVADRPGSVQLDIDKAAWSIRAASPDEQGDRGASMLTVESITVPEVLRRAGVDESQPIDLLKSDIEGAEAALFGDDAASVWLSRSRVLAVEVHGGYELVDLQRDIRAAGCEFEKLSEKVYAGFAVTSLVLTPGGG